VNCRGVRRELGWTRVMFAAVFGLSVSQLSAIERGEAAPSPWLQAILEVVRVENGPFARIVCERRGAAYALVAVLAPAGVGDLPRPLRTAWSRFLGFVAKAGMRGVRRSEIYRLFGNRLSGSAINRMVETMEDWGLVTQVRTETGGRPALVLYATSAGEEVATGAAFRVPRRSDPPALASTETQDAAESDLPPPLPPPPWLPTPVPRASKPGPPPLPAWVQEMRSAARK